MRERTASQGPRALLESPTADAIVTRTQAEPRPGTTGQAWISGRAAAAEGRNSLAQSFRSQRLAGSWW